MVRSRFPLVVFCFLGCIFLEGCDLFLTGNFPAFLSWVKNFSDLKTIYNAHSLTGYAPVSASFPDKTDRILLYVQNADDSGSGGYLGIERKNFRQSYWISGPDLSNYVVDTYKGLASGLMEWEANSGSLLLNPLAKGFFCISDNPTFAVLTYNILQGSDNFVLELKFTNVSYDFTLYRYPVTIFDPPTSQTNLALPISADPFRPILGFVPSNYKPLQAIRWSNSQIAVLVHGEISQVGMVRLVNLDLSMTNSPSLGPVLKSGFPTRNNEGSKRFTWLTKKGVIVQSVERDFNLLTLYSFDTLPNGQDTAEFRLPVFVFCLGFKEDGTEWVAYDERAKKLFLLRTWW